MAPIDSSSSLIIFLFNRYLCSVWIYEYIEHYLMIRWKRTVIYTLFRFLRFTFLEINIVLENKYRIEKRYLFQITLHYYY